MNNKEKIKWLKKHNENAFKKHNILEIEEPKEVVIIEKEEYESLKEENQRLNNVLNELEEYIKRFLYMLNGILDRDVYEQCQLDDFTMIMEKLNELKESDK